MVTEVVEGEFRRVVQDGELESDVVRYGIVRAVRDVVEELVERGEAEYEVAVRAEETVNGDEAGVLADEWRFPNAKAALRSLVREILRTRLREVLEELVES